MNKVLPLLLIGFLFLPVLGQSQTRPEDDQALRALYEGFFDAFRQAGAEGAAAYLRRSGAMDEDTLRRLERRAQQMERSTFFGRPDSFSVVRKTEFPVSRRVRAVYVVTHHDRRPIAWRLRFYKRVTGVWIFTDVAWEEKFVEDFVELPELEFAAYKRLLEEPED